MGSPSFRLRFASLAIHIFGASILAYCFAVYTTSNHLTWRSWRHLPWARICITLVFVDTWLFHIFAGFLIQDPGFSDERTSCTTAIFVCISIYCISKILIYCFFLERVYVVWPHDATRLSSKAYRLCLVTMLGYVVVTALMVIGKNAIFDKNECMIGLKPFASIPLLSYDLFLNVFLTSMFLWPLQQAHFRDVRLRKITTRTLFAALVALTTSAVNITILTIMHGFETKWIFLLSWGLDVTINALALHWVTLYRPEEDSPNMGYLTTINFTTTPGTVTTRSGSISRSILTFPAPTRDDSKTRRFTPPELTSGEKEPSVRTGGRQTHAMMDMISNSSQSPRRPDEVREEPRWQSEGRWRWPWWRIAAQREPQARIPGGDEDRGGMAEAGMIPVALGETALEQHEKLESEEEARESETSESGC